MLISKVITQLFDTNIPVYIAAAVIPVLFLLFVVKERKARYILAFFCWGIFSVALAFIVNTWFGLHTGQPGRVSTSVAPIVEETLKALPLLLFLGKKQVEKFDRNLVLYCAFAAGIGFSVVETIYYFSTTSVAGSGAGHLFPIIMRTVTTCLMHGMATAILGFGIAVTIGYKMVRAPMLLGLLALAATLHSLFNILLDTRLAIVALLLPLVLYVLGLLLLSGNLKIEWEKSG